MRLNRAFLLPIVIVGALVLASTVNAQETERRIALVVGNGSYAAEQIPTAANDAGLIAQTLQAAGFDVVGARDLDQDALRRAFRDFLDKATASGPNTVAFIYLNGYGLQLEGENYFAPVDAKIAKDSDVSVEAVRISDYLRPLAGLNLKASIVVLDTARAHPFAKSGQPLASGLSLVDPEKGVLIAFNAAPGTVGPQENGPYGTYAQALAEMIRTGGLPLNEVFDRVRLRVNENTKGGEVPWDASKIDAQFVFFERAPDAPPPAASNDQAALLRSKPIRELDARDAYIAALGRDTLHGYLEFLETYPHDPAAKRVRAIVAARREAITWHRTRNVDTPRAYWSYLRRYPRGPHSADARRRLEYLSAAFEPPPSFEAIEYDVPPPPEEEAVYFRRPVLFFDDPDYDFVLPPPPPVFFLPPPPPDFVMLPPPPPPVAMFVLPVPEYVAIPTYYNPPSYVAPPPPSIIYNNIHNTVVINQTTNIVTVTNRAGQTQTLTPAQALAPARTDATTTTAPVTSPTPASRASPTTSTAIGATGVAAGAALLAPSLPPSVAKKATTIQTKTPAVGPGATPTKGVSPSTPPSVLGSPPSQPGAHALPGTNGRLLPPGSGKTAAPGQPPPAQSQEPGAPQFAPTTVPARFGKKSTPQPLSGAAGRQLPPVNRKPINTAPLQVQKKPAVQHPPTTDRKPNAPVQTNRTVPAAVAHPNQRPPTPVSARPPAHNPARPTAVVNHPRPTSTAPAAPARLAPAARPRAPRIAHPAPAVARPAPPPAAARPAPVPARQPAPAAKQQACRLPNGNPCPPGKK